jgi:hypothetical protein
MSVWLVSYERTQSCHVGEPYDMVPRMTLEIRRPLEPKFWYSMLDSCISVGTESQRIPSRYEIELKRLELGNFSLPTSARNCSSSLFLCSTSFACSLWTDYTDSGCNDPRTVTHPALPIIVSAQRRSLSRGLRCPPFLVRFSHQASCCRTRKTPHLRHSLVPVVTP